MTMNLRVRRLTALCALPFMLAHGLAHAVIHAVEVTSTGNEVNVPLPPGTQEVELETQRAGNCRFGRTWGYDLTARQLWVNGGCAGTFKVHVRDDAVPATASAPSDSSNAAAGLAAMAAIAGVAILASQGNKHHNNNGYYPPPVYPPQGYPPPPPPPGAYPGGYPQGGWAPPPGSRQSLMRHASGACMDAKDGARPGTPINVWDCHGRPNQVFYRTPMGELVVQGLCVEPAGGAMQQGARLVSAPCNGTPMQRWAFQGAQIRNLQNGLCLDVLNGQARRGAPVAGYFCNGGAPGQRWFW